MDSFGGCYGTTVVSYSNNPLAEEASEVSTAQCEPFHNGDEVKLSVPGFGEVGGGLVVDACPQGQWLGVDISLEPGLFILLQPHTIFQEAHNIPLSLSQRDITSLWEAIDWTILWIAKDVRKLSDDLPMDISPFVPQENWIGLEVHLQNSEGTIEALGRINCWRLEDHFQGGTLGEEYVGVTMLDVFLENKEALMTDAQWPISSCWFPSGCSLKETIAYFAAIPIPDDPLAYLGGRLKAPYRFIKRKPILCVKESLAARKT